MQLSKDELATIRRCSQCVYLEMQYCRANSNPASQKYCDNYDAMRAVWAKIRPSEAYMSWSPTI